jgi:hypothetical protein
VENRRAELAEQYDAVLIDCPSGTSAQAAICLAQLSDTVVAMAGDDDLVDVLRRAEKSRDRLPYSRPRLAFVPIPPIAVAPSAVSSGLGPLMSNWLSREVSPDAMLATLAADARQDRPLALAALLARELDGSELLSDSRDTLVGGARKGALVRENEIREETRALLLELAKFTRSPGTWDIVEQRMGTLQRGVRTRNWSLVADTTVELELSVVRGPTTNAVDVPVRVRSLIVEILGGL